MSFHRMELTRSIDKATNKVPAQMHAHHPVGRLGDLGDLPYSDTFASPFSALPWQTVPVNHRRRMLFIMQHPAMAADRLDVM